MTRICPSCYRVTWTRKKGVCLLCRPLTAEELRERQEKANATAREIRELAS